MSTTKRTAGATLVALAMLLPFAAGASEEDDDLTGLRHAFGVPLRADVSFGPVLDDRELAAQRGGDVHVNQNNATATVEGNVATNLSTGDNSISGSAFTNTTGVPMVVQNSGNNVVIQNSTILNLQLQ